MATRTRDGSRRRRKSNGVPTKTRAARSRRSAPRRNGSIRRPNRAEFFVDVNDWKVLCHCLRSNLNTLLIGPTGCGKTELCQRVCDAVGRPLITFNLGAMSEPRISLIGNTRFDSERGTWFERSRFVRAIETPGCVILLDEISRCHRDAFNILFPVLDGQQRLPLDEDEGGVVVEVAPQVTFFATANLGAGYTGARELDVALLDRFASLLQIDFPPPRAESQLLQSRCPGISREHAELLIRIAVEQRKLADQGDFLATVSTRSLIAAGRLIGEGMPLATAVQCCIVNRFSSTGGDLSERARMAQLTQRFLD